MTQAQLESGEIDAWECKGWKASLWRPAAIAINASNQDGRLGGERCALLLLLSFYSPLTAWGNAVQRPPKSPLSSI